MAQMSSEKQKCSRAVPSQVSSGDTDGGSTHEEPHLTILDNVRSEHVVPGRVIHVRFQFKPADSNGTFPPPWLIPR